MQYILTQEERNNLVPLTSLENAKHALEEARKAMLEAANFTCWHSPESDSEWDYCDDCPCSSIADGKDYKIWELICGLSKNYSQ